MRKGRTLVSLPGCKKKFHLNRPFFPTETVQLDKTLFGFGPEGDLTVLLPDERSLFLLRTGIHQKAEWKSEMLEVLAREEIALQGMQSGEGYLRFCVLPGEEAQAMCVLKKALFHDAENEQ